MNLAPGAIPNIPLFCIVNGEIYWSTDQGQTWSVQSRISGDIALTGEVTLPGVADFAAAGITFNVPVNYAAPTQALVSYRTGAVDFQTAGFYALTIPRAPAGKSFVPIQYRVVVTTKTGAATGSGTLVFAQSGVDISASTSLPAASWNQPIPAPYSLGLGVVVPYITNMDTLGLQFHLSLGVVGPTALTGFVELFGFFE